MRYTRITQARDPKKGIKIVVSIILGLDSGLSNICSNTDYEANPRKPKTN